jgi:hypothetical protein
MFPDDSAAGEAFGAGGADEIVAEDVEHGDAGEADDVGHGGEGEGESGEDDVIDAAPGADGPF